MNKKVRMRRQAGFTLLELTIAALVAGILTLSVGILLANGQRYYNRLYTRVNGQAATDAYAACRAFDTICRKSSRLKCDIAADGSELTLYYYRTGSVSSIPDRYAYFYISGDKLFVGQGPLKSGSWIPDSSIDPTAIVLAGQVDKVRFSAQGTSVSMQLSFDSKTGVLPVGCTAVRHNE